MTMAADDDNDDTPRLGPCCICGGEHGVIAIVMLGVKGAVAGHGWGCVVCGLPMDGAPAVLCKGCLDVWQAAGRASLRFACRGYPADDGRVPIGELTEPHVHDVTVVH